MIWAAELDRCVTYICEEWSAVTGQPPSESLGLGWLEAVHPEERDMICGAFLQAFEHRCTFTLRYRLRRYTGDHMWVAGAAAPSFAPKGAAFIGFLGIVSRLESGQDLIAGAELRHYRVVQPTGEFAPMSKLDLLADHLLRARSSAVDAAEWLLPQIDDALCDVGREIARQEAQRDASGLLH
ncbi:MULTISPECIES: PAS domain-containing protein [Methylobacterium]|jgi:PAS fold|uniref:PAS domain-containing protein n=1 Tax=Methylobacterium TaxID=407 RepID=UPI000D5D3B65|nr:MULTISPECIES: PAS domain-containing protein [Methylobacterium]MDE3744280.1 PAS domain-containing protein [Methylobacterium radiotolerans]MWV22582.1 PAS domain-containing protein [Methylobacterium sp. 2A]PVZ07179.1 PAS domain-containing protein [Methylobacterium organophilum]